MSQHTSAASHKQGIFPTSQWGPLFNYQLKSSQLSNAKGVKEKQIFLDELSYTMLSVNAETAGRANACSSHQNTFVLHKKIVHAMRSNVFSIEWWKRRKSMISRRSISSAPTFSTAARANNCPHHPTETVFVLRQNKLFLQWVPIFDPIFAYSCWLNAK